MSQPNFGHIVTGREEDEEICMTEISALKLSEGTNNSTDRARAVLKLITPDYDSMSQPDIDSRTLYFALNSIKMELMNVQKMVEAYALENKQT